MITYINHQEFVYSRGSYADKCTKQTEDDYKQYLEYNNTQISNQVL